jgi:hypothetical protein
LPAILFLAILVFNFIGYRMLITYMERGHDAVLEKKLDKQEYSDDELLSIKTKLNLPYYTASPQFERTYGSININGVVYEYVKKRVYNDTLELLCLPNTAKTKLQEVKNELTKSSADGQTSGPVKKAPSTLKLSLPDFCQSLPTFATITTEIRTAYLLQNLSVAFADYSRQQERPPQTIHIVS